MDSELIYSIFGILGFIVVIILTLRSTPKEEKQTKTKAQKKEEVIAEYTKKLQAELQMYENDKEARVSHKKGLLKVYSDELSRNIFFDEAEVSAIIKKLALT